MAKNSSGRAGWLVAGLGFGVAAGVALGTLVISPNMPDGGAGEPAVTQADVDAAREDAEIAEAQAASADSVIAELADSAVEGTLVDRPVMVMHTAGAAPEDVDAVASLLDAAGAVNAGRISLSESFFTQEGADQLKAVVANTLPAGAQLSTENLDPGTHAGEALGSALLLDPESGQEQATSDERGLLLRTLRDGGFLSYEDGTILPAQVIVFVTGTLDGGGDAFAARNMASFARALDSRGNGTVLAGRIRTAADTGPIGLIRADEQASGEVSTVDSVGRAWGRMATVLAVREQLNGEAGAYGSAASAEAATPAP
ncbi:copper transporter [Corynebacterium halotolerans]|uniref:Copper transporter n=1 Tax=Corynebacterium halotolerans YIM 70093 = DSM 44683 TaxID=1121362 RepID=M1NSE0_9CORY|nr:copper transporter [Corynebacterium halotolerans]AGF72387.1 hypothetical protein A605_06925 [Corynebacterium halotolerans YIM 70093 = DSM 44683]